MKEYVIALLTMIPLAIPLIQNTGLNIVVAQNKHGFRAIVYLLIAIFIVSKLVTVSFKLKYSS